MRQYLTGTSVMVADGVMIFCAYTLVVIRLWFRLVHQRVALTISDIFLMIACLELLAIICVFIKENEMGAMHEDFSMTSELMKMSFATVLLYDTSLYFLKFSILTMYSSIFPIGKTSRLRRALYVVIAITAAFALTAPLMAIFWCGIHFSKHWTIGAGCTFWNKRLFITDWIMNMISDILILILPFPLLYKLKLSRRQIAALCVTFGLGTITIVVSTLRFTTFMRHSFVPLYVWSVAEISTGIMVVSLPALRPLLRKAGNVVSSTTIRRQSSWPMQTMPPSSEGGHSFRISKSEHRSRYGEPPDGYHYTYDEERAGSDLELHGGLKSDMGSKAETIAVYADVSEVMGPERPRGDVQHRDRDVKAWVQKTRQLK